MRQVNRGTRGLALALWLAAPWPLLAAPANLDPRSRATQWNDFAQALVELTGSLLQTRQATTETRVGGYAGQPGFYREQSHYGRDGRLLARLRWETAQPDNLHSVEVFIRDAEGRALRDYSAEYLPNARRAPYQTLVNLFAYSGELVALRQFDASGELLYEHCTGTHADQEILLALEPWDLPYAPEEGNREALLAAYRTCFDALPATAVDHLDPRTELAAGRQAGVTASVRLADLDRALDAVPDDAGLHAERGLLLFEMRRLDEALVAFDRALTLDPQLDAAHFGRGMALGRLGHIDEGIAALTRFIERNPDSSLGYTKRGVRHLWNGDPTLAEHDFRTALRLDPANAEAHDDLGVILAQRGDLETAEQHFRAAMHLEPDYQKAHHNLALVLHLGGNEEDALEAVDAALRLDPGSRESLLLKGVILDGLGRTDEAAAISARAAALPANDWSERAGVR